MSYWGRVLGGIAGFAVGGPFGAVLGATLGRAAEEGLPRISLGDGAAIQARLASALGGREHLFAMSVVVLTAKLAKCDGPVVRSEIDAFKRQFRIPPEQVRDVGRLFDQARDSGDAWQPYATVLGERFADDRTRLEGLLAALFVIARADKPLTRAEHDMLREIHAAFGLDALAWDQARGAAARVMPGEDDPYTVLGMTAAATDDELRRGWLRLVRDHHPDSLASRGAAPEQVAAAGSKVARINAAWDRIKRDRRL
jgi:DnaJ like chaperone protein